jgi:hypothetical protein
MFVVALEIFLNFLIGLVCVNAALYFSLNFILRRF